MDRKRQNFRPQPAIAAVIVLVTVVGGVWWLWVRDSLFVSPPSPLGASEGGMAPPPALARPAALATGMGPAATSKVDAVEVDHDGEGSTPLAPADGPVIVTVKFVGPGEPPAVLEVNAIPDADSSREVRLPLTRGVLTGRLPAAKQYSLSFAIDGWMSDQFLDATPVPQDQSLSLEVMLPQAPSLWIVDSVTQASIPSARAIQATWDDWASSPRPEAVAETFAEADGRGRIAMSKTARARGLWIGAEGHAWNRVEVSPEDRDRIVALAPGGGIRVEVEGVTEWAALGVVAAPAPEKPAVGHAGRNESNTTEVFLATTAMPGAYVLNGVLPGKWRVRVGWRMRGVLQQVLRSVETEVRAGATSEVRVRVDAPPPALRTITLEVVVPEAWGSAPDVDVSGVGSKTLGVRHRSSDIAFVEGPKGTWRTKIEKLPTGPYSVSIKKFGFISLLRVGTETTLARVEVPIPATLRIRVFGDPSGELVPNASIRGHSPSPFDRDSTLDMPTASVPAGSEGNITAWVFGGVRGVRDEKTGDYVLQVPSGRSSLDVSAPGYIDALASVNSVSTGTATRQDVRLTRGGAIVARVVRDGSVVTSVAGHYDLDAVAVEGIDPNLSGYMGGDFSGGAKQLDGLRPGRYRLHLRLTDVEKELVRDVEVGVGREEAVDFDVPSK